MNNTANYKNNIYHLLKSSMGSPMYHYLIFAKKAFEIRPDDYKTYSKFENMAEASLLTIYYCELISCSEYLNLENQLNNLMRLYKKKRSSALGRKDVPTMKGDDAE